MKANISGQTYIRSTLFYLSLCMFFIVQNISAQSIEDGWQKLIDNDPFAAQTIFGSNTSHSSPRVAGAAYRGLAFTAKFLGNYDTAQVYLFKSFLADKDTALLHAAWINVLPFGRSWFGHTVSEGYTVMKMLTKQPSMFNGEFFSLLADRYLNDGAINKAHTLVQHSGIIRTFQMIGPFDNISGSGHNKVYPPEKIVNISKTYEGKDGAQITWFPFYNKSANGWMFTEYNYSSQQATLYYYTNVCSEFDQEVYVGFGASGTFKVFLNDNLILADPVYRNTGTDMFIQKVSLFKGDNKLLVKISHDDRYSNFCVRFMDHTGAGLSSVTYKNSVGDFTKDTSRFDTFTPSPLTQHIETILQKRIAQNKNDHESAILLMDFYNASELTDKGQLLARRFLDIYPKSSLWHSLYSESLQRSLKTTEALTALNTAYKLCPHNFESWKNELNIRGYAASTREVMDFITASPELFQNSADALLYMFGHYSQSENETKVLDIIERLEEQYADRDGIVSLVANYYINNGNLRKAASILKRFLKWERTSTDLYSTLAMMYLKMGQRKRAVRTYLESIRYAPNSPGFYYYLAKLALQYKEYSPAQEYIDKALSINPASSPLLSLKGTILNTIGETESAKQAYRKAIQYTYNDFNSWEQLLPLEGKPKLTSLAQFPDPDSLRSAADSWEHLHNDNGAIIAYMKDVIFYPSRCSQERYYIMVHLPTQSAIDTWKEYSISYNSYYQALSIPRAYSKNAQGTEIPADIEQNMVVFKTLQPGDDIVLEWTIENYYQQDMAKHLWGEHSFDLPFPVFQTELRFIEPQKDTIPHSVQGDSITVAHKGFEDFRVTTFSRSAYSNPSRESYALVDPPESQKVFYSTITRWADVVQWYANITENKLQQTLELKALADSLLADVTDPYEKVKRLHHYITHAIRYSFVPFRQSAWIPQPAREVRATKIGDCKDMASLGKTLLDYAGIQSNLVLVNTRDQNGISPSYIGPNFNHCILSYTIHDSLHFIDFTDNNLSVNYLPPMDQGALALVIKPGNNNLIHLPIDKSNQRQTIRTIHSSLDAEGVLVRRVDTKRSGVFARHIRSNYRFLSPEERRSDLQQALVEKFPGAVVDSLFFSSIDSLTDTVGYGYTFTAHNAAQFSTNVVLFALHLPDQITPSDYPSEIKRSYPIDMMHTWFGIGSFSTEGSLTIPQGWKLINTPEPVSLCGSWGTYTLSMEQKNNTIYYSRQAEFNFNSPVSVMESDYIKSILSKIAHADDLQLVFMNKDSKNNKKK